MQKTQLDMLMSDYYDPRYLGSEYQVSAVLSTLQRKRGDSLEEVKTVCYITKGIWTPCQDAAPHHERFDETYGWISTLHWLHSKDLTELLNNHLDQLTQRQALERPFGVLDLEAKEVRSPTTCVLSLSTCIAGQFSIQYLSNGHKVSFRNVPNLEVRRVHRLLIIFK